MGETNKIEKCYTPNLAKPHGDTVKILYTEQKRNSLDTLKLSVVIRAKDMNYQLFKQIIMA